MVGAGAGYRGRRLDDIEAIHLAAGAIAFAKLVELAAAIKLFHVADVPRSAGEEIGVQGEDYVRFFRPVHGVDVTTECQLGALARAVASGGLPLMPLRLRVKLQQVLQLLGDAWRRIQERGPSANLTR